MPLTAHVKYSETQIAMLDRYHTVPRCQTLLQKGEVFYETNNLMSVSAVIYAYGCTFLLFARTRNYPVHTRYSKGVVARFCTSEYCSSETPARSAISFYAWG